jgi:ABC-type xylose transport system substrate-binding protein
MASGEDRPIIVSGGDQMVTVTLPASSKPDGGSHTISALKTVGPFKTIVITNNDTNKPEFHRLAAGNWTITIE